MLKIGPRISEATERWLSETFVSKHAGAEMVLAAFPTLYRRGLAELRGKFNVGELSLLLDTFNGIQIVPGLLGQHVVASATDAIRLDALDKKWNVDGPGFLQKLSGLSFFEAACMELWLRAFWEAGAYEKENAVETWTAQLIP